MASASSPAPARRAATQARGRRTVARILDSAAALIAEKGAERVTMTEIAQHAGLVIGTLYQYFADRPAVHRALFLRHADWANAMLAERLAPVRTLAELERALDAAFDTYFAVHQTDPQVAALWTMVQVDAGLQEADRADTLRSARLVQETLLRLRPDLDPSRVLAAAALLVQFTVTASRFAHLAPEVLAAHTAPMVKAMSRDLLARLLAAGPGGGETEWT